MFRILTLLWSLHFTSAALAFLEAPARSLRVSGVFSNDMVLQRDQPIPVWGWGAPGTQIFVSLGGEVASTLVDEEGNWLVHLPPRPAGGPYDLQVTGGGAEHFTNVMVGDVWICAGQSNMQMNLRPAPDGVYDAERVAAEANDPGIRLLEVPRKTSFERLHDLEGEPWKVCTPETVQTFSAVGYFFGRDLHQHLGVPIGLINCTWGASPAEAWTSLEALESLPEFAEEARRFQENIETSKAMAPKYKEDLAKWNSLFESLDSGQSNSRITWAESELEDTDWETMPVPGYWENHGHPDFDGVMWYRKTVELPAAWEGRPLDLGLCSINDMDRAYFNGIEVGRFELTAGFSAPRIYPVPGEIVRGGRNVIAVRIYDAGNVGGMYGSADDLWLRKRNSSEQDVISLAGEWRFRRGVSLREAPPRPAAPPYAEGNHKLPSVLFNAMISPLTTMEVRGVIWYQGESNIGRARQYFSLFPALIEDWRGHWGSQDLPFLFVQLAATGPVSSEPVGGATPLLREAQRSALRVPNTAMVVTLDISDPPNGHPRNKLDVGKRLALAARRIAYGEDVVGWGPLFRKMSREGSTIRVEFESTGGGLRPSSGEAVKGFAVAGEDRKFVWADAVIEGDGVLVSNPEVPEPIAVRYGWSENPPANLENSEGLPASPFRTDDWE